MLPLYRNKRRDVHAPKITTLATIQYLSGYNNLPSTPAHMNNAPSQTRVSDKTLCINPIE